MAVKRLGSASGSHREATVSRAVGIIGLE